MKSLTFLTASLLVGTSLGSHAQSYVEPITWTLEDYDSGDGELYKTFNFQTVAGVGYFLQTSNDLANWTNEQFYYGMGQEIGVSLWSDQDLINPPDPETIPSSFDDLPTYASLVLRKVTGETGLLVSWQSLEDGTALQYHLSSSELAPTTAWDAAIFHVETVNDYTYSLANFTMLQPEDSLPANVATDLEGADAALMTAFESDLSTINATVAEGDASAANLPSRPPLPSSAKTFFRLASDWSMNSDGDHRLDWEEWQNGSGTDAFNPDSNGDGNLDGTTDDLDQDGVVDMNDAAKNDPLVNWQRAPVYSFALIEIEHASDEYPIRLTDKSRVLFQGGSGSGRYWHGGDWYQPNPPSNDWSASYTDSNTYNFRWVATFLADINDNSIPEQRLLWHGETTSLTNPSEQGWWDAGTSLKTVIAGNSAANEFVSFSSESPEVSTSGLIMEDGQFAVEYREISGGANQTPSKLRLYSADAQTHVDLTDSANHKLTGIAPEGYVLGRANTNGAWSLWNITNQASISRSDLPSNQLSARYRVVELPNNRAGVSGNDGSITRIMIEDSGGVLRDCNSVNLTHSPVWSGNGTAFGFDETGKLFFWRNDEINLLENYCPSFGELIESGELQYGNIQIVDTNNNGSLLITTTDATQEKSYLLLTVSFQEAEPESGFDGFERLLAKQKLKKPWLTVAGSNTVNMLGVEDGMKVDLAVSVPNAMTGTVTPEITDESPELLTVSGNGPFGGAADVAYEGTLDADGNAVLGLAFYKSRSLSIAIHVVTMLNDDVDTGIDEDEGDPNTVCIEPGEDGILNTFTLNNHGEGGDDAFIVGGVSTGPNGICETTADPDDEQVIEEGKGKENVVIITPGPNGVLNTPPNSLTGLGDDIVSGETITTGPDGIRQTLPIIPLSAPKNVPSQLDLSSYFERIFGKQANIHFTITQYNEVESAYDVGDQNGEHPEFTNMQKPNGYLDYWTEDELSPEEAILRQSSYDANADLNLYFLGTPLYGHFILFDKYGSSLPIGFARTRIKTPLIGAPDWENYSSKQYEGIAAHEVAHNNLFPGSTSLDHPRWLKDLTPSNAEKTHTLRNLADDQKRLMWPGPSEVDPTTGRFPGVLLKQECDQLHGVWNEDE